MRMWFKGFNRYCVKIRYISYQEISDRGFIHHAPIDDKSTSDSKVHGAKMGPTWVLLGPCRPREPCSQGHWYHGFSIEKSWHGSEANIMYLNLKKSKWFIQQLLKWIHSKFMFLVKNEMGIKLHLKLCRLKRKKNVILNALRLYFE